MKTTLYLLTLSLIFNAFGQVNSTKIESYKSSLISLELATRNLVNESYQANKSKFESELSNYRAQEKQLNTTLSDQELLAERNELSSIINEFKSNDNLLIARLLEWKYSPKKFLNEDLINHLSALDYSIDWIVKNFLTEEPTEDIILVLEFESHMSTVTQSTNRILAELAKFK